MSEQNNINNNYAGSFTNVYQSSHPEDFNFHDDNPPIHQSHTRNFLPFAASFPLSCNTLMNNTMGYENIGDHTGDYAPFHGNPSYLHPTNVDTMNGQLNPPNYDQAETHANGFCPLPAPFQTSCNPQSDTTNDGPTDNNFQRLDMMDNSTISYILTHDPTSSGYVFMKVEYTQLGRISAADIDKIFALTQM